MALALQISIDFLREYPPFNNRISLVRYKQIIFKASERNERDSDR